MSSVSHRFAYAIDDRVLVDHDIAARVIGLMVGANGHQYQVAWWHNGNAHSDWFVEWRLTEA